MAYGNVPVTHASAGMKRILGLAYLRHIVPALLDVASHIGPGVRPQILLTTHAPLVLSSLETRFDARTDKSLRAPRDPMCAPREQSTFRAAHGNLELG